MGSLRNPIGPLPSSIYWRRRAVALSLVAVLALVILWAVNLGGSGGDGDHDDGKGAGGGGSAGVITPGPSSSGPVNSQRPGGRDEASESGDPGDSDGAGSTGDADGGSGGGGGPGDGGGSGAAGGSAGAGAGGGIGAGGGQEVPAGSSLPDCARGTVTLTVRSIKNSYGPGERPRFQVVAKNSGATCKVDFGHASTVLTITDSDDEHVWASDDCLTKKPSALLTVPAKGETKRTVEWDRKRSAKECATPSGSAAAKPGTYLVEARVAGLKPARVSFVLAKD